MLTCRWLPGEKQYGLHAVWPAWPACITVIVQYSHCAIWPPCTSFQAPLLVQVCMKVAKDQKLRKIRGPAMIVLRNRVYQMCTSPLKCLKVNQQCRNQINMRQRSANAKVMSSRNPRHAAAVTALPKVSRRSGSIVMQHEMCNRAGCTAGFRCGSQAFWASDQ